MMIDCENFNTLYSQGDEIQKTEMGRMEERRSAFKILTGTRAGKNLQGGLCVDGRKILDGLEEIGINARNWDDSALDRDYWRALMNSALNLRGP